MERAMLDTLAAYHSALHGRLWDSVMQVSDDQFVDGPAYAHGSIRNQLVHLAMMAAALDQGRGRRAEQPA